jgi:hypothetical protein
VLLSRGQVPPLALVDIEAEMAVVLKDSGEKGMRENV